MKVRKLKTRIAAFGLAVLMGISTLSSVNAFAVEQTGSEQDVYKRQLVQRRISPEITTSTVIAWRRNIPYSLAVRKMIEEINAFQA